MNRLLRAVAAASLAASAWTLAAQEPPRRDDAVLFAENLMIPMRDGVRLATDIYRPAVSGVPVADKLPLLLHRTGYDKTSSGLVRQARAFAAHGYVVAVQDDRGTYKSEGVQYKYVGWGKDGYDTIEWLARLPYTDGQVGCPAAGARAVGATRLPSVRACRVRRSGQSAPSLCVESELGIASGSGEWE